MKPRLSFIDKKLEEAKRNNLYRRLRYGRICGSRIFMDSKSLLNLCSNDYLGIPPPVVVPGQMQSSSRLVSGNDEAYKIMEDKLARHKSHQDSLVYPTGYMANMGVISALVGKGDTVLSDELNHASIIESCKLAGAKTLIYKHNDMGDLADKIKQRSRNKFVITEGIFSMDGDYARLQQIAELAQQFDAATIVDDAHGDFVVGKDGKGTPNKLRVSKKIDVYISSLSKGLGSFGGYVASQKNVIDLCVNRSKPFIYTSALPSFFIEYSLKRLGVDREIYRKKLFENVKIFTDGLKEAGYKVGSKTHIIPIIIGNEKTALDVGKFLYQRGVFVQPIRYPTVAKSKARLRISMTAWLSKNDIDEAITVFEKVAKRFKI